MTPDGYDLDDDPTRVDRDAVYAFLSTEAYRGRWRERAPVDRQLDTAWRVVDAFSKRAALYTAPLHPASR